MFKIGEYYKFRDERSRKNFMALCSQNERFVAFLANAGVDEFRIISISEHDQITAIEIGGVICGASVITGDSLEDVCLIQDEVEYFVSVTPARLTAFTMRSSKKLLLSLEDITAETYKDAIKLIKETFE